MKLYVVFCHPRLFNRCMDSKDDHHNVWRMKFRYDVTRAYAQECARRTHIESCGWTNVHDMMRNESSIRASNPLNAPYSGTHAQPPLPSCWGYCVLRPSGWVQTNRDDVEERVSTTTSCIAMSAKIWEKSMASVEPRKGSAAKLWPWSLQANGSLPELRKNNSIFSQQGYIFQAETKQTKLLHYKWATQEPGVATLQEVYWRFPGGGMRASTSPARVMAWPLSLANCLMQGLTWWCGWWDGVIA